MPEKPFNLPHTILDLKDPSAGKMIQQNFETLAHYLDGKLGGLTTAEAVEQIANGQAAFQGTTVYRAEGAPTNAPSPTGAQQVHAPNGTMILTLGWTYTQGAVPADFLILFKRWQQSADPGDAQVIDPAIAIKPADGANTYTFEGLNPSYKWSFGIAAARKTESGLEFGPLRSIASWVNVTIGVPNFEGTVDGTPAEEVSGATSNFNTRNDRKGTPPAKPTIKTDGTAIDHTINDDGSADVSFEWLFWGAGDAGDIDGFVVYVRLGTTSAPYVMGTSPNEEQAVYFPASVRAHIIRGVRADGYYTFGVRAYRDVDQDIDLTGRLESAIIQPSIAEENPYRPSASVEFKGNITGTIDGVPAAQLVEDLGNAIQAAADAQATADGKITTFVLPSTTPPTAEGIGDFWIVKDQGNNLLRWNGSAWEDIRDQGIPQALQDAAGAQATADGKIVTFFQASPPTATAIGDLWFDTDDGNKPYRAASKGADQIVVGEWEAARDRAAANFDARNDRISTAPANPAVAADGTAVDHSLLQTGSADISFEWGFSGSGDAYDIDGFLVYIMARTSSAAYTFGTNPNSEECVMLPKDKLFHILRGVDPTFYYTFGVQAYRVVDPDIDSSGVKKSAIVKPSLASENPYHPASNTAWPGDVTGSVGGTPVARVANTVGFGDGSDGALNTTGDITFDVTVDGEPVVKRYTSVTINAGHTVTVSNRCKGLIILCQGNVVINGAIRMDDKAAKIGSGVPGGTSTNFAIMSPITSTFAYMLVPVGGAGGDGGKGGGTQGGIGGKGGSNSAFGGSAGGGGGGGAARYVSQIWYGGGDGGSGADSGVSGGQGGIGGGSTYGPTAGAPGDYGTGGGILAIIAGGNITIGATGVVSASAVAAGRPGKDTYDGSTNGWAGGGGGGKGAGVAVLAHKGSYTNLGSVVVNGSDGGDGGNGGLYDGEAGQSGQAGSIMVVQL